MLKYNSNWDLHWKRHSVITAFLTCNIHHNMKKLQGLVENCWLDGVLGLPEQHTMILNKANIPRTFDMRKSSQTEHPD